MLVSCSLKDSHIPTYNDKSDVFLIFYVWYCSFLKAEHWWFFLWFDVQMSVCSGPQVYSFPFTDISISNCRWQGDWAAGWERKFKLVAREPGLLRDYDFQKLCRSKWQENHLGAAVPAFDSRPCSCWASSLRADILVVSRKWKWKKINKS